MSEEKSLEHLYNDYGGEGLTMMSTYDVLVANGRNPIGLTIIDFFKKIHGDDFDKEEATIDLDQLQELSDTLGDSYDELLKAFTEFDNGDGMIDQTELKSIIEATNIWGDDAYKQSQEEFELLWNDIIAEADTDNDSQLSIKELVDMIMSRKEKPIPITL